MAISVAIGGDCLADIAQVRSEAALFGRVASDPTVPRLVDTLALDAPGALAAANGARPSFVPGSGDWAAPIPLTT